MASRSLTLTLCVSSALIGVVAVAAILYPIIDGYLRALKAVLP